MKTKPEVLTEKELIVEILSKSFKDNKSVNMVIAEKQEKIPALMSYSYEMAKVNGKIFIADNKQAVALILFPKKKKFSLKTFLEDLKLAVNVIGLQRVPAILKRESSIKNHHPKEPFIHLWYIGVDPENSGKGYGSSILKKVISFAESKGQDIYLETSTVRNINFYERHGFENFANIDSGLPFQLMLFRRKSKQPI